MCAHEPARYRSCLVVPPPASRVAAFPRGDAGTVPSAPNRHRGRQPHQLRDAHTRFASKIAAEGEPNGTKRAILAWVDALLDGYLGHKWGRIVRQNTIPEKLTPSSASAATPRRSARTGSSMPTPMPPCPPCWSWRIRRLRSVGGGDARRIPGSSNSCGAPATASGLLTNGLQFRLVYAGLDFESWCEWESDRWFDDGEGSEELAGLRQLLSPDSLKPVKEGVSGLLAAVEESRNRQARLSDFLQENVREAIEFLLEDVSKESRTTRVCSRAWFVMVRTIP